MKNKERTRKLHPYKRKLNQRKMNLKSLTKKFMISKPKSNHHNKPKSFSSEIKITKSSNSKKKSSQMKNNSNKDIQKFNYCKHKSKTSQIDAKPMIKISKGSKTKEEFKFKNFKKTWTKLLPKTINSSKGKNKPPKSIKVKSSSLTILWTISNKSTHLTSEKYKISNKNITIKWKTKKTKTPEILRPYFSITKKPSPTWTFN